MEQVQRRYVKFKTDSLDINSIGFDLEADTEHAVLPIDDFKLIEPFFTLQKNPVQYYPLIVNGAVTGFRRRELFENNIVLNTEDDTVKALRSFENFIAKARIVVSATDNGLTLVYDSNYFDAITHQENIDRLSLAQDKVYNIYVTRKGDPFAIYSNFEITLKSFLTTGNITLPYTGTKDISVYVVAKD